MMRELDFKELDSIFGNSSVFIEKIFDGEENALHIIVSGSYMGQKGSTTYLYANKKVNSLLKEFL